MDLSLSEIYNPDVLGAAVEPVQPLRPMEDVLAYVKSLNVSCKQHYIGTMPVWPEALRSARLRFANRFLAHLHRSLKVRKNCLIVSHAECVGVALRMMPSQVESGLNVLKVEFGGMFLARRQNSVSGPADPAQRSNSKMSSPSLERQAEAEGEAFSGLEKGAKALVDKTALSMATCSSKESTRVQEAETGIVRRTTSETLGLPRRGVSIESFTSTASCSSQDAGDDSELQNPKEVPKVPCSSPREKEGWEVQTHNIQLQKVRDDDCEAALARRMKSLTENNGYSREQLQVLLGQLSDAPLSGSDELLETRMASHRRPSTCSSKGSKASSYGSSKDCRSDDSPQVVSLDARTTTEGTQSIPSLTHGTSSEDMQAGVPLSNNSDHSDFEDDFNMGGIYSSTACSSSNHPSSEDLNAEMQEATRTKNVVLGGSFNSKIMARRRKCPNRESGDSELEASLVQSPPISPASPQQRNSRFLSRLSNLFA
jgi:hypothetical protein